MKVSVEFSGTNEEVKEYKVDSFKELVESKMLSILDQTKSIKVEVSIEYSERGDIHSSD